MILVPPRHRRPRPGITVLIYLLISTASVLSLRFFRPKSLVPSAAPRIVDRRVLVADVDVPASDETAGTELDGGGFIDDDERGESSGGGGGGGVVDGAGAGEAPEPYPYLFGFDPTGGNDVAPPNGSSSPDPLVRYTWSSRVVNGTDGGTSQLQLYRVERPVAYRVVPPSCVDGAESLLTLNRSAPLNLTVKDSGSLMLDYGVERAAWMEFTSPDLGTLLLIDDDAGAGGGGGAVEVTASISEFDTPYPGKTRRVTRYGDSTYRLETNDDLYEGVRFAWLHLNFTNTTTNTGVSESRSRSKSRSFRITSIALVALAKPTNYVGSFRSSDEMLTRSWYTGAYGVRLNMEDDAFNSVLMERGDRVSIQGDGHVTMAAALVAFSPYRLIHDMLNQTNSGHVHGHRVVDQNIMAYPLYWTMSLNDHLMASGYVDGFKTLAPDAMSIVDDRIEDFLNNPDIVWMGWDDRLGNGWCFDRTCDREAHLAFAALVVRACRDLGRSLLLAGMTDEAGYYSRTAQRLLDELRDVPEWPRGFGLHSASNVIATGLVTSEEAREFFLSERSTMNDPVNVCSYSPFNQYWILQALGDVPVDGMEYALASIKLCWGPMLRLGRGCFWEIFSPQWTSYVREGGLAPGRPSYCHPWSSGVTAWLSRVAGGISPLLPGYGEYVAAPYVSGRYPRVSTTVPTPRGSIVVNATLTRTGRQERGGRDCGDEECDGKPILDALVTVSVEASVPGYVGLYRSIVIADESGGGGAQSSQSSSSSSPPTHGRCSLDVAAVLVDGERCVVSTDADIVSDYSARDAKGGDGFRGVSASEALGVHFGSSKASELLFARIVSNPGMDRTVEARYRCDHDDDRSHQASTSSVGTSVAALKRRTLSIGRADGDAAVRFRSRSSSAISRGIPHYPPFPIPEYPAASLGLDRRSRGDGLPRHGSDGYVLFGYRTKNGTASDLVSLPSYIRSVTVRNHGYDGWNPCRRTFVGRCSRDDADDNVRCASFIPDPRRPPSSSRPGGERALGVIAQDQDYGNVVTDHRDSPTHGARRGFAGGGIVGNGHDAEASILMDVELAPSPSPSSSFVLSIYCVAGRQNSTAEEHAIRAMDLETFNVIAPNGYVSEYSGGVWWSLRYDRSIRLRITSIKGVRVSAVAFAGGATATVTSVPDGVSAATVEGSGE